MLAQPRRLRALARLLVLAWLVALAATGVTPARADDVSAAASLVDAAVDAGQPAEYHIDVTNGRLDEPPPAPTVDGLNITFSSTTRSTQYRFDGSLHGTSTTTFIYSIETSKPGRFVIPGQDLRVDHQTLSVSPVTLNVMGAGRPAGVSGGTARPPSQSYFAELVIPKKSAYVGESIPVELRLYFGQQVRKQIDPNVILSGDGFSVQKFTAPQQSAATIEDQPFYLITYKSSLAGVKTGTIAVGPAESNPVVQLPRTQARRRSNSFNDPFDQLFSDPFASMWAPPKQVTVRSDPVSVEIKPLPPGRPADFSGAIGQFTLTAEADPRKASPGDPITMHLSLQGKGNFDRIGAPVLNDATGLRSYPATSKFKADDDVGLSGLKSFAQVVIADSARTTLPGYRFSYFDPVTARYETLQTPPLPVVIQGASLAVAATPAGSAAGTANVPAPSATPTPTPRAAEDILYIRNDFGVPRAPTAFLPLYRQARFWEVQGWAALLILGGGALYEWRRHARNEAIWRRAELQRQRASLDRTVRQENTGRGEFYSAARRLAQLKAAAASNRPAADLTPGDISAAKHLPPDVAGSVAEIFQRHDELAYSGRATNQEPVPADERRAILATLETLGKN